MAAARGPERQDRMSMRLEKIVDSLQNGPSHITYGYRQPLPYGRGSLGKGDASRDRKEGCLDQLYFPTISKCFSVPVWMMTVSLCSPPMVAGRPFTVAVFTTFASGIRSFMCSSLGAPARASSTVAATLFDSGLFWRLRLTRPQRVGAWSMRMGRPEATQARGTPFAR